MIDARVKFVSSLDEFERRMSMPLVKLGLHLTLAMVARIRRGQGADQPLRPLGADSVDKPGTGLFWVAPNRPQPSGYVVKPTSGEWAGWAAYPSYREYARLRSEGPRDLDETGEFLRSIRTRALGPHRVKVAPYGTHAGPSGQRISNTSLGYLGSRGEPKPLLHPSREEILQAARIVFAEVEGQAIEAARIAGVGFDAKRRAASVQRRASRLLAR